MHNFRALLLHAVSFGEKWYVRAYLGKHGDEGVHDNLGLGQVGGGHLDEDVPGVEGDFWLLPVDDGGHGQDGALGVVDHRVDRAVPDDAQILLQVTVRLKTKVHA